MSRAGYGTIDTVHETILIERDWNAPGVSSIAGTLKFSEHGSYIEDLKRGDTAIVSDAYEDERTHHTADVLAAINARSFINMPVTEHGRFVALIFVNHEKVRDWTPEEIAFMRDLGQRTRTAVERRRAELSLQASERRLGTAIDIAQLGTCEWEMATDAVTLDGRTRAIFAFGAEENVTAEMIFARIHPDDIERVRGLTEQALANPGRLKAEYRIQLPDGRISTVVSTNDFLLDAEGSPERTVGVFEDITRRRQTEAELRALNESLESRVAERTAELLQAQEALRQSQKLEAIGQLTGGVAHDFNNLLTVIGGSADLLRRPNLAEDKRERCVEAITTTVARAAKLTAQLLAFARRQSLRPEIADAVEQVRSAAEVASTILGTGIKINVQAPQEPCFTNIDAGQLGNAIVNMASNARDAMAGNGILTLSIAPAFGIPPLRGHAFRPGAFVAISVGDTGQGIEVENLGRIFEPFFTTKAAGQETGLGLSQVFGFAKQSGGDVSVESKVGQGARFTLYLPRTTTPERRPVELGDHLATGLRGDGCILVVEDNPDVREFAVTMLAELGYATVEAPDAQVALEVLAKAPDRFHLVFSDVMMPGMTGIELGREIQKRYAGLPIILASGYSDSLADDDRLEFELIKKPYSLDQLAASLARCSRPY